MKLAVEVETDSQNESAVRLISRLDCSAMELSRRPRGKSSAQWQTSVSSEPQKSCQGGFGSSVQVKDQSTICSENLGSILLCRGQVSEMGPIRCLFATDHSKYASDSIAHFFDLQPMGIRSMTVFSVVEPTFRMTAANLHRHLADIAGEVQDARRISHLSTELADQIAKKGIQTDTRLRTGHVANLIDAAYKDSGYDLLIIGAQGTHAEISPRLGSISRAVAHIATYPTLILRP